MIKDRALETLNDAINALEWALENTTCEDRLQSDKFNILTNALVNLKDYALQKGDGREVEFSEWLRKNYRTHEIYGSDLSYNLWREPPRFEVFSTSTLFQLFLSETKAK